MTVVTPEIETNPENKWRLETPGEEGWERTARPGAQPRKKYYMVSCDTHLPPPAKLFIDKLDPRFHKMMARVEVRDGAKFMVTPTGRADRLIDEEMFGEDLARSKAGASFRGDPTGDFATLDQRIAYQEMDGVDGEVIFPNGPALMIWAGDDVEFVSSQCRIWNDWQMDFCRPRLDRCAPTAAIPALDVTAAIAEVEHVAKLGYKVLTLPNRPHWGALDRARPGYNHRDYEPLWAAIQDHDLTITFHAATGKDPRAVSGFGGAIVNYVIHGCGEVMEPMVTVCASGIFERYPKLRVVAVEGNAGWVPWAMDMMDEAHLKHHFWTRPKLKELPSTYFRSNCGVVLAEDRSALLTVEPYRLENNLMWANDFPHHEGSWPHSAQAIERIFGHLREDSRAKILGLNAARFFGFEVPEKYR